MLPKRGQIPRFLEPGGGSCMTAFPVMLGDHWEAEHMTEIVWNEINLWRQE